MGCSQGREPGNLSGGASQAPEGGDRSQTTNIRIMRCGLTRETFLSPPTGASLRRPFAFLGLTPLATPCRPYGALTTPKSGDEPEKKRVYSERRGPLARIIHESASVLHNVYLRK